MAEIRRAGAEYIDSIAVLEPICFPEDAWSREMVAGEFSGLNDTRYFIAEEDGEVVGYAGVWLIKPEGYITNVAVHPDHRRKRIASALLSALLEECGKEGVTDVTLEVRVSNAPAKALYESFGFESAGIRKRYYSDGEDAEIMWRR